MCLVLSLDKERHMSGVIEQRGGTGDAGRLQRVHPGSGHKSVLLVRGLCAWKQRCRMTIRPHAQQNAVKAWHPWREDVEVPANHVFIAVSGRPGIRDFAWHTMNVIRSNGQVVEERLAGHPIITVLMIWRDMTFVAPEKMDTCPVQLRAEGWGGEQCIQAFRR